MDLSGLTINIWKFGIESWMDFPPSSISLRERQGLLAGSGYAAALPLTTLTNHVSESQSGHGSKLITRRI